jgi:(4S)-4-hydroxy-5-phosphonooxypentane-2,3-dione isomerase
MHIVLVQVVVRHELLEEFARALLVNAQQSMAHDAGCVRFDVGQEPDDPTRWVLYEVYESPDDHRRHRESPHFRAYDEVAARAVTEKRVTTYVGRQITGPSPEG